MCFRRCVEELKTNEKWVLPALKMMREICCLYEAGGGTGVRPHVTRQELIDRLQTQHSLVILVTDSLTHYMDGVRKKLAGLSFKCISKFYKYNFFGA